jgi:electron transport complex protein RnfG
MDLLKKGLILMVYTLIAGLVLGGIYVMTKPSIQKSDFLEKERAMKIVLKDWQSDEMLVSEEDITKALEKGEKEKVVEFEWNGVKGKVFLPIYEFNTKVGKVYVLVGAAPGFGGDVKVMAAFIDGKSGIYLNAIKVLDASQETPGLGARILEESPQKRFYGIPQEGLEHGVVVDKDAKGRKGPGVVKTSDIMTGATITPRAVANAINIMYAYLTQKMGGED